MSDESTQVEGAEETPEMSMDDLFNEHVEHEQVAKAASDLLLKEGTYTTVPALSLRLRKDPKDDNRPYADFYGPIQLGDEKGRIGFRLSWVRRNKVDFNTKQVTDKPDAAYVKYGQAVKAFEAAYGHKANTIPEVLQYIRDFPVRLRVGVVGGEDDPKNYVFNISPVREG